ncbi:hypothetical protein CDD83_7102 [Cordyceps sp. RAO-2017]|nr:hypothetical protein CDD83_7102 [Cordyceps sp. RAO-2017]
MAPCHSRSASTGNGNGNATPASRERSRSPAAGGVAGMEPPPATKRRSGSGTVDGVPRLSAAEMRQLTSAPDSLPVAPAPQRRSIDQELASRTPEQLQAIRQALLHPKRPGIERHAEAGAGGYFLAGELGNRPSWAPRTVSSPPTPRAPASDGLIGSASLRRYSFGPTPPRPPPLNFNGLDAPNGHANGGAASPGIQTGPATLNDPQSPPPPGPDARLPSPIPNMIPLPPMSLPTHLQLELAAQRPSPLYIHHSHSADLPYESNAVKLERLKNIMLLPPYLERTLYFGALACLDAWLYNFTILPIRFTLALAVLAKWWGYMIVKEARWLVGFDEGRRGID